MDNHRVALWNELFTAAEAFRRLAPWQWMYDSQVFGIRVPGGDDIGWCVVIGHLGQHFGLILYCDEAGWRSFRDLQDSWPTQDDAACNQYARCVTFERHAGLSPFMKKHLKTLRRTFSGGEWPETVDLNGFYQPDLLVEEDIPWMVRALRLAPWIANRVKDQPDFLDPDNQGRLWVETSYDESEPRWERLSPPSYQRRLPTPFPFDAKIVHQFARSAARQRGDWLVDWARPFPVVLEDRGTRPYHPLMLIMEDLQSRYVLAFTPLNDLEQDFVQEFLHRAQHRLPERLVVRRKELLIQLAAFAAALHLEVVWMPEASQETESLLARMRDAMRSYKA